MPVLDKSNWPETVDGTTDWQALFENEETGLIAIVSSTKTPAQLRKQTDIIIRAIFNRKRDQPIVLKVTAFLDKLIPEDVSEERFPAMQDGVRKLLEKVKDSRIKRAAAFVAKRERLGKRNKSNTMVNRRANLLVDFFRRSADILAIVFGLILHVMSLRYFVLSDKKKTEKDTYFRQEAYIDIGGGITEWRDDDVYVIKESNAYKAVYFNDGIVVKEDGKYESWDDY